ncbi:glycosyltransferase [Pseudoduganella sp. GCM10020061]|uniref:glycosyltransferase n=1 Tax=Pseudoduganella sp. GCM10020061 TaxID=3317345 RepID=UPI00362CD8E0
MLTVLMASFNGAGTLPQVLDAYCRLLPPDGGWVLRIVDDGSTDGTAQLVAGYRGRLPLQLLRLPRGGKSAALNAAIELALREDASGLFVFTDDDATPDPDWLRQLDACARAHPGHAVFGGTIVPGWPEPPPGWVLRQVPLGVAFGVTACTEGPVFPGLVWGANMAVRRGVFEAGHRFDHRIGPNAGAYAMGSETEFTRRLGQQGYHAWFCEAARVTHHIRPSQLRREWLLGRVYRFGRGARRQEQPPEEAIPQLFGVPRWMLAKYASELARRLGATLMRRHEQAFAHAWELAWLRGYFVQAWRGADRPHIVLTGLCGALGGMELRMAQEAGMLAASGYRSTLALPRFPGAARIAELARAGGAGARNFEPPWFLETWPWRRTRKLWAATVSRLQLALMRPSLVHVSFCWTSYGATLLWLARKCGRPSVVAVHNAFPPATIPDWHAPHYREAFQAVRGVYAVSNSALSHFLRLYSHLLPPGVRLAVIPNCVDPERFLPCPLRRNAARQRYGLASDALVIGSVARLAPQKRPAALIELLAMLRPRFPSLHLLLVGSGPLEAELRALVREKGLEEAVRFAGHVDAVEDVIPALDLHLLVSRNEGFGTATIEAMSCAVPAVGTDVPGTADVLAESAGGVLVPLGDAQALAQEVAALLDDPLRRIHMGRSGRAEVQARYTPQLMQRRVREFYAGLSA